MQPYPLISAIRLAVYFLMGDITAIRDASQLLIFSLLCPKAFVRPLE